MEPVEQRWEESEGKYLHKKFKKMATASAVSDPPLPPSPPPPRETQPLKSWEAGAAPPSNSTPSVPPPPPPPPQSQATHGFPLKHSALSMLSSPPLQPEPTPPIVAATLAAAASRGVDQGHRPIVFQKDCQI